MFYDRIQGNQTFSLLSNPPTTRTPQVFFGNLDTLASGSQSLFPVAVRGNAPDGYVPTTYNWNLSIQRELPFKLLFDIAYVGSSSAHLLYQTLLNEPAFGSAWLPENQDPTAGTPRFDGSTTLAVNFTRPYPGYGTIRVQSFGASSNYHALELAVNRRLSRSLQFGLAYTWSKVLGTADSNTSDEHPTDLRNVNYGLLTFDRTHNLVVNYIYDFPKLARGPLLNNGVGRALLNNWTLSGLTSATSGAPDSIGYTVQGVRTIVESAHHGYRDDCTAPFYHEPADSIRRRPRSGPLHRHQRVCPGYAAVDRERIQHPPGSTAGRQ